MMRRVGRLWLIGLAAFAVSMAAPGVGSTQGVIHCDAGVVTPTLAARDSAAVQLATSPGGGSQCGAGGLTLQPLKNGAFLSARCDQGVVCT